MARLSKEKIGTLLRAKHREPVKKPLYYAPPFLDELRKGLQERLASRGARYSNKTWQWLAQLAEQWSQGGVSVSPSQVAARIVEVVHRAGAK